MEELLNAREVKKRFKSKLALKGINLTLDEGKIYGLFGPNGSGKTTFMKVIAGILQKDSGEVKILGEKIGIKTKNLVCYLPDKNYFYKWMKIRDAIDFFNDMFPDFDKNKANELVSSMDLTSDLKINDLSKGMLARVKLSLALARDAKLHILDEPLSGIDPVSREKIIEVILNQFESKRTLLISTHLIQDVEKVVDEAIFILDGEIILKDSIEKLREEKGMSLNEFYKEVYRS